VAVVYQNNWLEAVLCQIDRCPGKYRAPDVICGPEEIKKLRAIVLAQFRDDCASKIFLTSYEKSYASSRSKQYRAIDNLPINRFKKAEMKAKVDAIYYQMFKSKHHTASARARISIAACDMALTLVPFRPGCTLESDSQKYAGYTQKWLASISGAIRKLYVGSDCDSKIIKQLVIDLLQLSYNPEYISLAQYLIANNS